MAQWINSILKLTFNSGPDVIDGPDKPSKPLPKGTVVTSPTPQSLFKLVINIIFIYVQWYNDEKKVLFTICTSISDVGGEGRGTGEEAYNEFLCM